MAVTMTGDNEILYASFPIVKFETDADGDLVVYGKASDGGLDSDNQIVDPAWMAKAAQEWLATGGNVRVQHNPQRDPAGVGVKTDTDSSGNTFVTAKVFEPVAQKLVAKGALRAYSVGIARPTIVRDSRAPGGRITGGELVEISLVDRPANKRCGIQLVKSVDGAPEYTGEVFGADEDIAKALDSDLTKSLTVDMENFTVPDDMSFTFTPNDLAKILKNKFIEDHYAELAVNAEKESRVTETPDAGANTAEAEITETEKEADPVVTKDPAPKAKKPKKAKGDKKLPPWLTKPADGDDDSGKAIDADTEKGDTTSGTPQSASGATDAAPMKEIPNTGPAPESPMPAGRATADTKADGPEMHSSPEMAALLRFKSVGIDTDLGRLHDLSCPAFHPDEVAKYHPFADFKTTVDEDLFRHKALEAAAGKSLEEAMDMQAVWQAAHTLKNADTAMVNTIRLELHKAFRDANPGPTSYPSPGCVSPNKYSRPLITDGHSATSPGHSGPNSSPDVASGPSGGAGDYSRPPLSSGHATPSPSFMKNDFEVPTTPGVPIHLSYAHMEKEQALAAISRMHTNLQMMVPNVCPMGMNSRGPLVPNELPLVTGVGKDAEPEVSKYTEGIVKAPLDSELNKDFIAKAFKKTRKRLGKKVLAGKITVDEARGKLGRMGAQKDAEAELAKGMQAAAIDMVNEGTLTIDDARKALGLEPEPVAATKGDVAEQFQRTNDYITKTYGPDVVKSAIAEAISPLQEMLRMQQESFETKLADQQKVIDAIADAPDPRGEPFSGLAVNTNKSARPAGVPDVAENAERTQQMILRQLDHTFRSSENPAEREAAWNAMQKYRGLSQ